MSTSVRTKVSKKQSSNNPAVSHEDREIEQSLLELENACLAILESLRRPTRSDTQGRYYHQKLTNIANSVSLALMEHKGPRHFHYHYRHKEDDETILHPVLDNPLVTLALACKDALKQCRKDLVGIEDEDMAESRYALEGALADFLGHYAEYDKKLNDH